MANRQFSFLGSYDGTSQRHHGYHFISEALPFARHANCARVPGQIRHVVSPLYRSSAQTGMVTRNPQAPTLSSSQHSLLHQMSPQQAFFRSRPTSKIAPIRWPLHCALCRLYRCVRLNITEYLPNDFSVDRGDRLIRLVSGGDVRSGICRLVR